MEIFNSLFSFITDASKKFSAKTIIILSSIVLVLVIDNSLGFLYYYNLEKKVSIVSSFNSVLKDSTLSKREKGLLTDMRFQAISHKSYKDRLWDFFDNPNIEWSENKDLYTSKGWNLLYFVSLITATCLPITFFIAVLILALPILFTKHIAIYNDSRLEMLFKVLGVLLLIYSTAIIEAKLLLSIPTIFNRIYLNWILNITINCILVYLFYLAIESQPKKRTQQRL